MSTSSEKNDVFWEFMPSDEYSVPTEALDAVRVRSSFLGFLRRLTQRDKKQESPLDPSDDLLSLSGERLGQAVPSPNWAYATALFEERVRPWLETETPSKAVVFYVAPPYSGREEILRHWAYERKVSLVKNPRSDVILGDSSKWLRAWPKKGPWLLPQLERCFLRHASGLDLVRELLSGMVSGELGRGIVGCDSWAWEYLQHVLPGRSSFTLSARAFDAQRLQRFFEKNIFDENSSRAGFRQADNGAYLFPERQEGETRQAHRGTIWVTPWEDLSKLALPTGVGDSEIFVLQSLLLHGGLDEAGLTATLPLELAAITEVLHFLKEAELVSRTDGRWYVTAYGYPAVRAALQTNDYLCDSF